MIKSNDVEGRNWSDAKRIMFRKVEAAQHTHKKISFHLHLLVNLGVFADVNEKVVRKLMTLSRH